MSKVTVLEDNEDCERCPTEEEVIEYAQFLEIDPDTEPHLLWIAREGVVAPIPHPWKACTEGGDDVFYFNFETGESVWDHPSDEMYKQMVDDERIKHRRAQNKKQSDEDRKRLELITNEISDEESFSPKSQTSPRQDSQISPSRGDSIQPVSVLNDSIASKSQTSPPHDSQTSPSRGDSIQPVSNLNDSIASKSETSPRNDSQASPSRGDSIQPVSVLNDSTASKSQTSPRNDSQISPSRGDSIQPVSVLNDSIASSAPTQPKDGDISASSHSSGKASDTRGSAGVGLAPAANLSLDSVEEAKDHMDNEQSSPSHSQSGSCPLPAGQRNGSLANSGGRSALEHSGASGQSGRSDMFSEVSEELISDFDGPARNDALADTMEGSLEFSATLDQQEQGRRLSQPLVSADSKADDKSGCTRLIKLQDDLASLTRVLGKLREIRGQQREFLDLLQLQPDAKS